ncbi:MAG TPA: hypothetical protein VGC22_10485, partial [Chitinophaga sp.]
MQLKTCSALGGLLLLVFAACGRLVKQPPQNIPAGNGPQIVIDSMILSGDTVNVIPLTSWSAFERFGGRYAYDVHLVSQEPLHGRIKALLGSRAEAFTERYQVMPPIDVENS